MLNNKINYYGVSVVGFDDLSVSSDVLSNLRRIFLTRGTEQKNKITQKIGNDVYKYNYFFKKDTTIKWKVEKNKRLYQSVNYFPHDDYTIDTYDANGLIIKSEFYDPGHNLAKITYYKNKMEVLTIAPGFDNGEPILFIKKGNNKRNLLYKYNDPNFKESLKEISKNMPAHDVSALTDSGISFFGTLNKKQHFDAVLQKIEEEIKNKKKDKVFLTPEDKIRGFSFTRSNFNMKNNGSFNIKDSRYFDEPVYDKLKKMETKKPKENVDIPSESKIIKDDKKNIEIIDKVDKKEETTIKNNKTTTKKDIAEKQKVKNEFSDSQVADVLKVIKGGRKEKPYCEKASSEEESLIEYILKGTGHLEDEIKKAVDGNLNLEEIKKEKLLTEKELLDYNNIAIDDSVNKANLNISDYTSSYNNDESSNEKTANVSEDIKVNKTSQADNRKNINKKTTYDNEIEDTPEIIEANMLIKDMEEKIDSDISEILHSSKNKQKLSSSYNIKEDKEKISTKEKSISEDNISRLIQEIENRLAKKGINGNQVSEDSKIKESLKTLKELDAEVDSIYDDKPEKAETNKETVDSHIKNKDEEALIKNIKSDIESEKHHESHVNFNIKNLSDSNIIQEQRPDRTPDLIIEGEKESFLYYGKVNKNYKRDGFGKTYTENGTIAYEGEYKNGNRHGYGSLYYRDGTLHYTGQWKENLKDGIGLSKRINDNEIQIGKWKDNKEYGKVVRLTSNGEIKYIGKYKNGAKNGIGVTFDKNENPIISYWEMDEKIKELFSLNNEDVDF